MIKYLIVITVLVFGTIYAENEIRIEQKAEAVTLYLNSAAVSQSINLNLKKGTNILFIDSLPSSLLKEKTKLAINNNLEIISYSYEVTATSNKKSQAQKAIKGLKKKFDDSITNLQKEINRLNARITTLNDEEKLIANYQLIVYSPSKQDVQNSKVEDLQKLAVVYSKQLKEIRLDRIVLYEKIADCNEKIEYYKKLNNLEEGIIEEEISKPNYYYKVVINSPNDVNAKIDFTYFTNYAYWIPTYNLYVNKLNEPLTLRLKGNILQNTGLDFKNVSLRFVSRKVKDNVKIPSLTDWYLRTNKYNKSDNDEDNALKPKALNSYSRESEELSTLYIDGVAKGKIEENMLSLEYELKSKYTINNGTNDYRIDLNDQDINASFSHFAIPKLSNEAYLVANVGNLNNLQLLSNDFQIYFQGVSIGSFRIDKNNTDDSLKIPLGIDEDIIVNRLIDKEYTEGKFLSSKNERTYGYEFNIRNKKKEKINLTIEDQVPISTNDDIKVEILESDATEKIENRGKLIWKLEIEPGKTIKRKFAFKVIAPKKTVINTN
jgi:uncharacterized protein (TIGR02231 family)